MHVVEKFQSCRAYAAKSNARAPKASKSDARHLNETSTKSDTKSDKKWYGQKLQHGSRREVGEDVAREILVSTLAYY